MFTVLFRVANATGVSQRTVQRIATEGSVRAYFRINLITLFLQISVIIYYSFIISL